jgi:hypothetical protein
MILSFLFTLPLCDDNIKEDNTEILKSPANDNAIGGVNIVSKYPTRPKLHLVGSCQFHCSALLFILSFRPPYFLY